MAFDITEPFVRVPRNIYNPISWFAVITCTFLLLLIGSYHFAITRRRLFVPVTSRRDSTSTNRIAVLETWILFMIDCLYCAVVIHMTYTESYHVPMSECIVVKYTTTALYTAFKTWTYIILIRRIYNVFSQAVSPVKHSKMLLKIWVIIMSGWTVSNNIISALTTEAILDSAGHCILEWSLLLMASVLCFEVTAAIVLFYLFARPLWMMAEQAKGVSTVQEISFRRLAVKQCVLSSITVVVNLICVMLVCLFRMTQTFAAMDVLVSSTAILLMYSWHNGLYRILGCKTLVERIVPDDETELARVISRSVDSDGMSSPSSTGSGPVSPSP